MGQHKLLQQLMLLSLILLKTEATPAISYAKPGCPEKCGNVAIPYPSGTKKGCYLNKSYLINCSNVYNRPSICHTRILEVLSISLTGQLRATLPGAFACYNMSSKKSSGLEPKISLSRFSISSERNNLIAVGCDARGYIKSYSGANYTTGCPTMLGMCRKVIAGPCTGIGCCQVPIPVKLTRFRVHTQKNGGGHLGKWKYNNCSLAFIVEEDQYHFLPNDFDNMHNKSFPVVLDWDVGDTKCENAQMNSETYACQENSVCYDHDLGYRCNCSKGYQGNPYLPNGCQDINECDDSNLHDCIYNCTNTAGSYTCSCPLGSSGDGRNHGKGCNIPQAATTRSQRQAIYGGVIMGVAASFLMTFFIYFVIKQSQIRKNREKFFKQNGGLMLQKLLFEYEDTKQMANIFTEKELKKATNNFDQSNVIGQGGGGTVYRGSLANNISVAIKKSRDIDRCQIEQFVNEVIILSQISHPNIVKLLGCCLETRAPLLVAEFITNKTLFHHLHKQDSAPMTFKMRLNIAIQTAEALAHMHSTAQIIHRDIKSSNILLNDDYTAKVSDFGISRFVPPNKTHLSTLVHGTVGYIDPEYFRCRILTEKSDVYSFGIVLIELLTGKKVFCLNSTESHTGLAEHFASAVEGNCLVNILDDQVKGDECTKQIKRVSMLAELCINLEGKKRPSMKEVEEELKVLKESYLIKA